MPTPNTNDPRVTTVRDPNAPCVAPDLPTKLPSGTSSDFHPRVLPSGPPAVSGDSGTHLADPGAPPNPVVPERGPASVSVPGYEIESVLGRGGMGVVYKARHLALKRTVALKMVLAGSHAGPQELARFRIEAEAVARLQHPNIVQIHEVGEADGHPYCALEFVEGGNLASKIKGKPMPAREAAKLLEALARAMQLAHSRNVVHRDLKPANILLTTPLTAEVLPAGGQPSWGTPKITDFGLARQMDNDSGETQAGAVMGTPSYMAPEQASGHAHEAGPAADVYALGAILYDCLAGRPPFKGKSVVETLDQVRTQEPVPPSRWQVGVPLDLDTICLKCLRKEPENRYASAAELANELVRYLTGEPILARPVGRIERALKWVKRNPAAAGAASALVLVLVAGAVVSSYFAVEANTHAKKAEDKAKEASDNETEARGAQSRGGGEDAGPAGNTTPRRRKKRAQEQLTRAEWLVYAGKLSLAQSAFSEGNVVLAAGLPGGMPVEPARLGASPPLDAIQRQTDVAGAHKHGDERMLQPRWQAHRHRLPRPDCDGVGCGDGTGTPHPQGPQPPCDQRVLQSRRQAPRHRQSGSYGEGVGCGDGPGTPHPQGPHGHGAQRVLQP